jgi:UDP-sulfoquinovose synthase
MGVYGYSETQKNEETIDSATSYKPGSVYHLSKVFDQQQLMFYSRVYNLKITELHQGVVWGSQTSLTAEDPNLFNRYDYDWLYGTVVNRFVAASAASSPLLIYDTGQHKRAFIHISDSVHCIVSAIQTSLQQDSDNAGRLTIANQFSEIASICEVADAVAEINPCTYQIIENPRQEHNTPCYSAPNDKIKIIAGPDHKFATMRNTELLKAEMNHALEFAHNFDSSIVFPQKCW